ncbi:hypothetical protein BF49_2515 [Bradyrhizobium sp.]|nr:hypothetical protein BF49_2515 [Bradyrhizobium sp.]
MIEAVRQEATVDFSRSFRIDSPVQHIFCDMRSCDLLCAVIDADKINLAQRPFDRSMPKGLEQLVTQRPVAANFPGQLRYVER